MERERKNNATSGGSLVVFFRCPRNNIPILLGVEYFTGELSIKCASTSQPWKYEISKVKKKQLLSSFLEV